MRSLVGFRRFDGIVTNKNARLRAVAQTPDSASSFRLREATSGRQSTPTTVAVQPAGGLALSWGKSGILTGGQEGMVSCWQANEDGLLVKGFEVDPGERWAEHVLWSADGTRFVTGAGKKLRIWSSTGELLRDYSNQSSTIAAHLSRWLAIFFATVWRRQRQEESVDSS